MTMEMLMGSIWVFAVAQLLNVILNTLKTIIMYRENKFSSALINAITYGFYTVIVVFMAGEMDLWVKIVITAVTNFIGVYISMTILDKFKKEKLWEITATVQNNGLALTKDLEKINASYNAITTNRDGEVVFHIYSKSKQESATVKQYLIKYNARYIVHEEKIKM